MDKIYFRPDEESGEIGFYVLEETRIGGVSYLLVTESEEEDAEAYLLKDTSADGEEEACYEFVEDEQELNAVGAVFAELLEDTDVVF